MVQIPVAIESMKTRMISGVLTRFSTRSSGHAAGLVEGPGKQFVHDGPASRRLFQHGRIDWRLVQMPVAPPVALTTVGAIPVMQAVGR